MKTLVVPNDGGKKMRVTEMYIAAINPNEGFPISEDFIHEFDEAFHDYSTEELVNFCREQTNVPAILGNKSQIPVEDMDNLTQLLTQATVITI